MHFFSGKLFILEMKVKKWNQIGSRLEQGWATIEIRTSLK